jgi:pantetheine-phosphate adenylyltransferase
VPVVRALYPGSFDPITNGHLDIIERGARIFDEVVASVVSNPQKQPLFSPAERAEMLREACAHLSNVHVTTFEGLLVEHVRAMDATVVIKGLRAISDFEFEFSQAHTNRFLDPGVETLFIPTGVEHAFLSSSVVREVARLGGDIARLVPSCVTPRLAARLARGSQ